MNMITWTDKNLADIDQLGDLVLREGAEQIAKWGVQRRTPFEWLCYLMEEVGELAEEISEATYRQGTSAKIRCEAIQVATLALKIAEMA